MNQVKPLSWKTVAAIALLVTATVPALAQNPKRRAVQHPSTGGPVIPIVATGTVVDAVTGQPVVFADVRLGSRSDRTDRTGKFKISTNIPSQGVLSVTRSGYVAGSQNITGGGTQDFTIHLTPTPTVRLRLTDGSIKELDQESIEFGYVPPFGSYNKGESDDFCKPDGTQVSLNRSQIKRIIGPATLENNSACCSNNTVLKITAELKSGETTPLYFTDSCLGYMIDFIGRDHVSANFVYTKFVDVAEIIFP
jgi:hypothetical protein